MKKYRVTEKHPYLKTGIILDQRAGARDSSFFVGETAIFIPFPDTLIFESNGWIEEIQENNSNWDELENEGLDNKLEKY